MEAALRKASHESGLKEDQRAVESINGDEESSCKEDSIHKIGNGRKDHEDDTLNPSSREHNKDLRCGKQVAVITKMERSSTEPNSKASSSTPMNQDDELESTEAKMGEAREENQRLRMHLDRITKDYKTLQMQFYEIAKQEPELVSLSLGRSPSSNPKKDEKYKIPSKGKEDEQDHETSLAIGLDYNFEEPKTRPTEQYSLNTSPENSLEVKEELAEENWPPHKVLKKMKSKDDEVSQQNPMKKARVSVRVRCDTPTMNDGCQWRKYGQKISKGNPCPRAYYRCSITPSCPVRKQVQRCAEDVSILINTYEGSHNHPLPVSATDMASTTSAAISMLMSGSSSSGTTKPTIGHHELNFSHFDNSRPNQFYLPNSSITSSTLHPTITLDLTSSSPTSSLSHFNKMPSNLPLRSYASNANSTNLNFTSFESNPLPVSWSNAVLNYGTQPTKYYNNQFDSLNFARQAQENFYQPHMHESSISTPPQHVESLGPDTIAAATKAITSDPSFQSALAAALTSIIGGGGGGGGSGGGDGNEYKFGHNLQVGEQFPIVNSATNLGSTSNANKCFSSYLSRSPPTDNSESRSMMFPQPSLPSSSSKRKSTSPADDRDHNI